MRALSISLLLLFVACATLPLLRTTARLAMPPNAKLHPPTLGVIVASHNEAAVLPVTLAALLGQTDRPDQIVIADETNSSEHDRKHAMLVSIVIMLCKPLHFRYNTHEQMIPISVMMNMQ